MILTEKETTAIKDLQTQEQTCIEKYKRYSEQAKDPVLKDLFKTLSKKENNHLSSLKQVLLGSVPQVNCNDTDGRDYQPETPYGKMAEI